MKRLFYTLKTVLSVLVLCLLVRPIHADNVPISTISQVATNAFSYYSGLSTSEATVRNIIPMSTNDTILLYICNFDNGFIIVSADNATRPILGFSEEGIFDINDVAPAAEFIINGYKESILYAKQTRITASSEIQNEWQSFINNNLNRSFYTPNNYLIRTKWEQSGGNLTSSSVVFNYFCPIDSTIWCRTIVGCGGVALAQILHYWACDVYPHGTVYNQSANVYLNLSDQSYAWYDKLPHKANIHNAKLLADCAISINSRFGCGLTTSTPYTARNILRNNWGFANANLEFKGNEQVWINKLKSNLSQRCPIYYYGNSNDPANPIGHAWVIDGFKNDDYFHCNFGWTNGGSNGWYLLSNIIAGGYNLSYNQGAILNIYPTTYVNTELINTTISSGTYTGHKVIIENSSVGNNANVIINSDCSTEIFGPFSVPTGSTLKIE